MNKKLYFLIIPLALTVLSFVYNPACTHGLCLFSGNGFPLGYYEHGLFRAGVFLADYAFFFIVTAIAIFVIQDVRRVMSRKNPRDENQGPRAH